MVLCLSLQALGRALPQAMLKQLDVWNLCPAVNEARAAHLHQDFAASSDFNIGNQARRPRLRFAFHPISPPPAMNPIEFDPVT